MAREEGFLQSLGPGAISYLRVTLHVYIALHGAPPWYMGYLLPPLLLRTSGRASKQACAQAHKRAGWQARTHGKQAYGRAAWLQGNAVSRSHGRVPRGKSMVDSKYVKAYGFLCLLANLRACLLAC